MHECLELRASAVTKGIGPDPTAPKPDKGRMIRARCPECGIVIRLAGKWISEHAPSCPNLGCARRDALMEIGR